MCGSYQNLRGFCWLVLVVVVIISRGLSCDIIDLIVHSLSRDKVYDMKGSSNKELHLLLDKFSKYYKKILLL